MFQYLVGGTIPKEGWERQGFTLVRAAWAVVDFLTAIQTVDKVVTQKEQSRLRRLFDTFG